MNLCIRRHFCSVLCLAFAIASFFSLEIEAAGVQWQTNYEQAMNDSKAKNLPIVLFFTGSDWCGWCSRLEDEVFNTQAFASAAGDKFIFVKVDFPLYKTLDAATTAQNKELQKKYDIKSYPTLILLNTNGQPIGTTGYRPGGGSSYAEHLLKMISGFTEYKTNLKSAEKTKLSGAELKKLYDKSKELDLENDSNTILLLGLSSDERPFFLLERYRFLAEEGLIKSKEAQAIRKELEENDPLNLKQTHFQLAVIDFEAATQAMEKESMSASLTVSPLEHYIESYGNKDKENVWRLHMIISQVYLNKSELQNALKHAEASYQAAPEHIKPDIALTIKNIETKLNS